jgi:Fe-S-cluster-containing dehydrogenase component/DMSO reductase anchor subunit
MVEAATSTPLLQLLLREQHDLPAVERFARRSAPDLPEQARHYRDLIPLTAPREGEQYAFEVDLDACSGCKACVTACHRLNGLEEGEAWRNVGLLHGGTTQLPVLQHVTTACHHCLEPACLHGCPVNAYEKDEHTGIVRHLDDQCIGCQYCMLTCPYDVPKYSHRLGIVRKCDMCHGRLSAGEAPACVQACPNGAIRITLVSRQSIIEESEANLFLPGAPEPRFTLPSTVYRTAKPLPRNLLPADYHRAQPGHGHLALVVMLVLTQMSVGAFVVEQALLWLGQRGTAGSFDAHSIHRVAALFLGLLGLGAAVLHLGRPRYAYRAALGWRTSWLSREIILFGLFAALATVYASAALWHAQSGWRLWLQDALGAAAALAGIVGVACSVMIYVVTRRPLWSAGGTGLKFAGTAACLGIPLALLIGILSAALDDRRAVAEVMQQYGSRLCQALMIAVAAKLALEGTLLMHLRQPQNTPLRRSAQLIVGELGLTTLRRCFFGLVGGIALPGLLIAEQRFTDGRGFHPAFIAIAALLSTCLLAIGELLERYLFFKAVVAPKMPGSPAS